jgi:hypothetical protein
MADTVLIQPEGSIATLVLDCPEKLHALTGEGYACFGTDHFRIGYRAFLAGRKPEFEGR